MNTNPLTRLAVIAATTGTVGYLVAASVAIGYLWYTTALVVLLLVWCVTTSGVQTSIIGTIAAIGAAVTGTATMVSVLSSAHILWFKGDYRLLETQVPAEFVIIVAGLTAASMMITTAEISPRDRTT